MGRPRALNLNICQYPSFKRVEWHNIGNLLNLLRVSSIKVLQNVHLIVGEVGSVLPVSNQPAS